MHIILGATGHVGSACARALLARGAPVLAVVHDVAKGRLLEQQGATVAAVDIGDAQALHAVFRQGNRAFLLNPPAAPDTDTDAEERRTVRSILEALQGAGLEKVVAESTMGSQPGERIGDSSVLWGLEEGLRAQPIPAAINRAAYYFSNFDMQIEEVRKTGRFQTVFPADFVLPMVAPADLGAVAARRMLSGPDDIEVLNVEGPERYSFADVGRAFEKVLGRPVETVSTPRDQWIAAFRAQGFSQPAAEAYARMTGAAIDGTATEEGRQERCRTTLEDYLRGAVEGPIHGVEVQ